MQKQQKEDIPTIQKVKKQWEILGNDYSLCDACPQTFFYTLANMLKLQEANNIWEIACGSGRLLPMILDLKKPTANYFATDISATMLQILQNTLQNHFSKYESKLSLSQWMNKNNLKVFQVNGEQPLQQQIKSQAPENLKRFDRVLANMVLMLTPDATKMLQNVANHSQKGCLFGLSVWGNKKQNNFQTYFEILAKEYGFPEAPSSRSNFYLYNNVQEIANKTGWEVKLCWEKNGIIPYFEAQKTRSYAHIACNNMKHLTPQQQKKLQDGFIQNIATFFNEKKALSFPAQCYILQKK